jgi:hypothetical protein
MALHTDPLVVGQALIVSGAVQVRSAGGVSQTVRPNSPIHLDDQIDTGADGAVSIIFADGENSQLDMGSMSSLVVDEDVTGTTLPELGDVTVEAGSLVNLLEHWEDFEPLAPLEAIVPGVDMDGATGETSSAGSIPGLDSSGETVAAADDHGGDDVGAIDDDFDMSNLIPPPEDNS